VVTAPRISTARRCAPPLGVSGAPTSIAAAVALLNALPPPVTVACFIESLDRPLRVVATASPFSAQPADGTQSPRILIRNGPLTMAVVPTGMGKSLLEFGEAAGEGRTIKGEVQLPPEGKLLATAPLDRIRAGDGTTCGACHDDESSGGGNFPEAAFASETLLPLPEFDVPLTDLRGEAEQCATSQTAAEARCSLLVALFDHGPVQPGSLPDGRICHGT